VAPAMIAHKMIEPPQIFVWHRAKKGDTLGKLARRYGTTVKAIQRANGLRSTVIFARKSYRIPRPGAVAPQPGPVTVPERRLPPPGTPAAESISGG
jgi:LysM repeat protein